MRNPSRDQLEAGIVIVGAGPAGLSCALHLATLLKQHAMKDKSVPFQAEDIYLIEKAAEPGLHCMSGAVMDLRALLELVPDLENSDAPLETPVVEDRLYVLDKKRAFRSPWQPAALRNNNNYVISISQLASWMARMVEREGVNLFTGISGSRLLIENGKVVGIQTDDKGLDRENNRKSNFEPGIELRSAVTVLAEGSRGSLTRELIEQFRLDDGCNEQTYSLGLKELWKLPAGRIRPGSVWHTLGYPLDGNFGGGWVYGMSENTVSLGLAVGLGYGNPGFDPYEASQRYKMHPLIRDLIRGGERVGYGAKTISSGGYWAMPHPAADGAIILGDGAGLVNTRRLKGIHMAIKSGMIAAEEIFDSLLKKSADYVETYPRRLRESWLGRELWEVRNYQQSLQRGLLKGAWHVLFQDLSRGRGIYKRYYSRSGYKCLRKKNEQPRLADTLKYTPDSRLTFDRSTSVFYSGTRHEEDQPVHIELSNKDICHSRCTEEYGNPCQYFCPAGVFEMVDAGKEKRLTLHASNCVHCKTCEIMDPYQIVTWVPPEGGGGPRYDSM